MKPRPLLEAPSADFRPQPIANARENLNPIRPTRCTIFTNISTVNVQSMRAAALKKKISSVQVEPAAVQIQNYRIGHKVTRTVIIRNCSDVTRFFVIRPPRSPQFRLVCAASTDGDFVAPGLFVKVEIEFLELQEQQSKFSDQLEIHISKPDEIVRVPLVANPAEARLSFESSVSFGVMVEGYTYSPVRTLQFHNRGAKAATVQFEYNHSALCITPNPIFIDTEINGAQTSEVTIKFLSHLSGDYVEKVVLKTEADEGITLEHNEIFVSATVVKQKLRLMSFLGASSGTAISRVDFGVVYFGQVAKFSAVLENLSETTVQWAITKAGEIVPNAPVAGQMRKAAPHAGLADNLGVECEEIDDNIGTKSPMTVEPYEGTLGPRQSCNLSFFFSPTECRPTFGFRSNVWKSIVKAFKIQMQLRILRSNSNDAAVGEEPINFLLSGKACPIQTSISTDEIQFEPVVLRQPTEHLSREVDISIQNSSSQLGIAFAFQSLSHFRTIPSHGELTPGGETKIKVIFQPNQLGTFSKTMKIMLHSPDEVPRNSSINDTITSTSASFVGKISKPIRVIKLKVVGIYTSQLSKEDALPSAIVVKPATKLINYEWVDKLRNREFYIDFLKNSRIQRMVKSRRQRIGNDGVQLPYEILAKEDARMDSENGLLPPEPIDFTEKLDQLLAPLESLDATQKTKALFSKLLSTSIEKQEAEALPPYPDNHLSTSELNYVYAARTMIDFGEVTVNSRNSTPLNFLNLVPGQKSIHINIQSPCENVEISSSDLLICPRTVTGVSVTFHSGLIGEFSDKLIYLVNGRYKYQISLRAVVKPVHVELSVSDVNIEVGAHPADAGDGEKRNILHQASEVIQIINKSNLDTLFEWSFEGAPSLTRSGIAVDGLFEILPQSGRIPSFGTVDVKVIFTAGIKNESEKTALLHIFDTETRAVCSRLTLQCRGEIPTASCALMTSLKQGPLDLGVCRLGYSDRDLHQFNALASPILSQNKKPTAEKGSRNSGNGCKTIKVKNTGSQPCFFSAHVQSNNPDIALSLSSGIIQPNCGICEIILSVVPTKCGIFEDEVQIFIIGGGKTIRVPFKYECRKPSVNVQVRKLSELSTGTIIGSSSCFEVELTNDGDVDSRIVVDFRKLPEFTMCILSTSPSGTQQSSRATTSSAKKIRPCPLSTQNKTTSLRTFTVADDIYKFDSETGSQISTRRGRKESSPKADVQNGNLYIFDVSANDTVICSVEFTPKSEKGFQMNLPLYVLGANVDANLAIKAFGINSPITMSKNTVNFRNKVVLKDTGIIGVAQLKNTSKETVKLTNTSGKTIQWFFDTNPLEDVDNVFKVEPHHGSLKPGSNQMITVSFHPDTIGVFESKIPLHIDFMGRQAPFSLEIHGTGVEPSVAFDPPEVFLPTIPFGHKTSTTFYIVNYGCERTEVKHWVFSESIERHGRLEIFFPEGRLLKNDGERLTVIVKFTSNPPACQSIIRRADSKKLENTETADKSDVRNSNSGKLDHKATVNTSVNQVFGAPLSFTTKLEISDSNRTFFLPIHGTVDSSALTLQFFSHSSPFCDPGTGHLFIASNSSDASFDQKRRMAAVAQTFKSPSGIPLEGCDLELLHVRMDTMAETILKWISDHIGATSATPGDFPAQFVKSNGQLLAELIESISNKKRLWGSQLGFNGVVKFAYEQLKKLSSGPFGNTVDKAKSVRKVYQELLNFLIGAGALLHSVKPEFLMSVEDFRTYCQSQMEYMQTANRGACVHDEFVEYTGLIEAHFSIISKEAWITVLLQIIRIFVMQLITLKSFRALPGVFPDESELNWPSTAKGNIYSTSEILLLRWLTVTQRTKTMIRHTDFSSAFTSGIPLAYLLMSHIPDSEKLYFGNFVFDCTTKSQMESNIRMINNAIKEIFRTSAYSLPVTQIVEEQNPLEIEFLLIFLYQTLPKFLTSDKICFKGALHDQITQKVEIANNSSRSVIYVLILTGDGEFQLPEYQTSAIEPRGQASVKQITLEPMQSSSFVVSFQPFEVSITPLKPSEFLYQLDGTVKGPPSVELLWTCRAHNSLEKSIRVTPLNAARDKAISYAVHEESAHKVKITAKTKLKDQNLAADREKYELPNRPLRYKVDYLSPYFSGPTEFLLKQCPYSQKSKKPTFDVEQNYTELHVTFKPNAPGKYCCKVVLTCLDVFDVRVFKIYGVAMLEGSKAELEFETPARQILTQEVPIINKTEDEWVIKASLEGPYFSGPDILLAKPRQTTNYCISFYPQKSGETVGTLILMNSQTSQKYIYTLRGKGLEPLPEGNRDISCVSREEVSEVFRVFNYTKQDAYYDVISDIPQKKSASPVLILANSYVDYRLEFKCIKVGISSNIVMFVNRTDESYVWFVLRIKVQPAPCVETIHMTTVVRSGTVAEIKIVNPTDSKMEYQTKITGDGLHGAARIVVDSNADEVYTLTHAPLIAKKSRGSIVFSNPQIGEFWYDIALDAIDAPPVEVQKMTAPLGKCSSQTIFVQNPINCEVIIHVTLSNTQDYQLAYPPIINLKGVMRQRKPANTLSINMKSLERLEIQVIFWPSSLTEPSYGQIIVASSQIGSFVYNLQGEGLMPEPMADTTIRSTLRKSTTSVISFTNPLLDPIPVIVRIVEEEKTKPGNIDHENEFGLLLHKSKYYVNGLDTMDIPFTYSPQKMVGRAATIVVEMGGLMWMYPIMGLPDAPVSPVQKVFECKAKERVEIIHELMLNEFNFDVEGAVKRSVNDWNNLLDCTVDVQSAKDLDKEAVRQSVCFALIDAKETIDGLALKFKDLHLFCSVSTKLQLEEAHSPVVDDVIIIEGAINKLAAVSFRLKNNSNQPRSFQAYFASPSHPEFTIAPMRGILKPEKDASSEDNIFVIGYCTTSYGKALTTLLTIECEDVSWNYEPPKTAGKKVAAAPGGKKTAAKTTNPLFDKTPRNFGVGQDIQPKRDLTRFVKWPEYVRLQRQKTILRQRLKVPPAINQFSKTLDKNTATQAFKLLSKYRPETAVEKKARLTAAAEAKVAGGKVEQGKKPLFVKYGINHITALVEAKAAQLVLIAHDVDPIEIVVFLPALCRKMGVPYAIVKGKSRLGTVVHKKTATALAITDVKAEDKHELAALISAIKTNFAEKTEESRKQWGGGIMGRKSNDASAKRAKIRAKELAHK
ncbi:Cilia- and flagella-associated protein 47 [Entophlyctis luteolus]|nr:Cilia- and flagella-associated protein 47 [Entophlyctis luteolus]